MVRRTIIPENQPAGGETGSICGAAIIDRTVTRWTSIVAVLMLVDGAYVLDLPVD